MPDYLLSFQNQHPHHCHGEQHNHNEPFPVPSHTFVLRHENPSAPRQTQVTSSLSHCPGVGIYRVSYVKTVFQTSGDMNKMHFQKRHFSMLHPQRTKETKKGVGNGCPFTLFCSPKYGKPAEKFYTNYKQVKLCSPRYLCDTNMDQSHTGVAEGTVQSI